MAQESGIVPQGPPEYWKHQQYNPQPSGGNPGQMSKITTGARGPNSPFAANQIVYVPGIGPMRLSDYGPGVPGIDVPVKSKQEMYGSAVNRMVDVNGQRVPLTGYVPGNRGADPTGGGRVDAYGNPIVTWSGQAPGGWEEPLANMIAPYETGPATSPAEFSPGTQTAPPMPNEGMVPTGPNGENFATNENMTPTGPNQYLPSEAANIPTNETMFAAPEFYPSESFNIPTYEDMQPVGPDEYRSDTGANVVTNESMTPTGPNEYLPSAGANVPTNEAMYPTEPGLYQDSTAGANIPTGEDMTANLAPDAYRPADESFYYPSGDGTYTQLDATGNPIETAPGVTPDVAPAQPVFDVNVNDQGPLYGDQKKPTTFFQDLGADITDIGNTLGTETPYNTALSGQPGFGAHPSSYTGPGGGAFWSPAGGVPLGPLGQGSHGMIPWDYYARMSKARMMKGGDPTLGLGGLYTRPGAVIPSFRAGGTGYGGRNMMGGYGIRGRGGRVATSYVNPNFYAPAPKAEASSQKPGGGAAAGGIGGGGPGGIA